MFLKSPITSVITSFVFIWWVYFRMLCKPVDHFLNLFIDRKSILVAFPKYIGQILLITTFSLW